MALAQIREIKRSKLVERSKALGDFLLSFLQTEISSLKFQIHIRGLGLLAGIEFRLANGQPATFATVEIVKAMLKKGCILLPEGEHANVIGLTPPLVISETQVKQAIKALRECI